MRDVEIKLPPGLAPHMVSRFFKSFYIIKKPLIHPIKNLFQFHSQKLLEKGDNNHRHPSADSIGRTSNPESITSSLTTHHSCVSTDSGAEVDSSDLSPHQTIPHTLSDSGTSDPGWQAVSLGQKCFSQASKTNVKSMDKLDPYVRIGLESNERMTQHDASLDSTSLTSSTLNLDDNMGFGTTNQNWTSTGNNCEIYIYVLNDVWSNFK